MTTNRPQGCGCARIPLLLVLAIAGSAYWWSIHEGNLSKLFADFQLFISKPQSIPVPARSILPSASTSKTTLTDVPVVAPVNQPITTTIGQVTPQPLKSPGSISAKTPGDRKVIRGIYLSRYQVTNNADEQTIRQRVRYYHAQGINTIIHGVWGNGCTMYNSEVMQQSLGAKSCPNQFQDRWLEWTIDEAH